MAQQLQQMVRMRQDVATLQERNRLARDLHDSVKQQVFAVSLQISTARALLERHEQAARTYLLKAESLIHQAQRELTTLITTLRPVELECRSLAEALQSYVHAFQEQTGISVALEAEGKAE
jgi:signal transduction histidine kinase